MGGGEEDSSEFISVCGLPPGRCFNAPFVPNQDLIREILFRMELSDMFRCLLTPWPSDSHHPHTLQVSSLDPIRH